MDAIRAARTLSVALLVLPLAGALAMRAQHTAGVVNPAVQGVEVVRTSTAARGSALGVALAEVVVHADDFCAALRQPPKCDIESVLGGLGDSCRLGLSCFD